MTILVLIIILLQTMVCSNNKGNEVQSNQQAPIDLITVLDTIYISKQNTMRTINLIFF